ncbi:MAG: DUF6636 domain-containing protein [Sporichthyaceae bacterium]
MSRASVRGGRRCVLAACVVLVAGCGSQDSAAGPPAPAVPTVTPSATTVGASSPTPKSFRLTTFRMPSGNIGCAIDAAGVTCGVQNASWTPPPRPTTDCEGDWGQTIAVDPLRARFVCASDTPLDPESPVLAYGSENRVNGYVCTSSRQELRCEHAGSGHGFTVSRSAYTVF